MAKRSTRQWIINGVLVLITLSFLGVSIAPFLSGIMSASQQNNKAVAQNNTSDQERIKNQIEGFEAVLKREPKNQTALIGLVELRLQQGDIKGSLEPLQTLTDANPEEPKYRLILARTRLQLNDREGAVADYRKILTTKPGNLEALQSLVGMELQDNRPEAAIGLLQDTLKTAETANKIQPNSVDKNTVLWILGELYRSQKRYAEATSTYDQISKENPKDFRPLVGKAQIKRADGKEEEAKSLFGDASKLAPAEFKDQINQLSAKPLEPVTATPKPSTKPNN